MKNKLLLFLLGLLGFSTSCEPQREEYGSPHILFHVSGKVSDAKGNPIKGINVKWIDNIQTDEQGRYAYSSRNAFSPERLEFTFTDPDGPANGGDFADKTVEVNLTEADRIGDGDGSWCRGEYAKTVDVTLEAKEK